MLQMVLVLPISRFILPIYQLKVTTKLNSLFFLFQLKEMNKKIKLSVFIYSPSDYRIFFSILFNFIAINEHYL